MSGSQTVDVIGLVLVLVLAVSALAAHKFSLSLLIRSLLVWAAIGLVAFFAVAHRYEIGAMLASVSERLGLDDQQVAGKTVRIRMSPDGHFWARVTLNGVQKQMLVDSGATVTAISEETARSIGLSGDRAGMPVMIDTANGTVAARRASVGEVGIGPLSTRDLGVVVAPAFGDVDVLGMNFLSRLKSWRVEGNVLVLEPGTDDNPGGGEDATGRMPESPRPSRDEG